MQLRLFDLMAEGKVTQQQLAQATGISQGNISDWKNGRSSPKLDALTKIADYFEVSVDYLIGHEKKPATSSSEPSEKDILYRAFCAADQGVQQSVLKLLDLPSAPFARRLA